MIPLMSKQNVYLYPGYILSAKKVPTFRLENKLKNFLYVVWNKTDMLDKKFYKNDFSIFCKKIESPARKRELVQVRQIFCYLIKEYFGNSYSLKSIGDVLGKRDHSTVIHGVDTTRDLLKTDRYTRELVAELTEKFKNELT